MIHPKDVIYILIKNKMDVDLDTLDHEKPLIEQGLDSLDMATLFFELEDNFPADFSDEDVGESMGSGNLTSIDAIVQHMNSQIAEK